MRKRVENIFFVQWVALSLGLLLFGGIITYYLYQSYVRGYSQTSNRLMVQARVINENLSHQLEATDRALLGIRDAIASLPEDEKYSPDIYRRLKILLDAMTGVRTLFVTDSDGIVRVTSRSDLLNLDVSHREYFQRARKLQDTTTLYVSPPYVTTMGVWGMNLCRVIPGKNGDFAGIVGATLDPEYFKTLMDSVNYSPDMWTALAHGDGLQFSMMPEREGQVGKNLAQPGSFFTRHMESGLKQNVLTGTVYATGEVRMMALYTIKPDSVPMDKPLVVAVGRDLGAITASWRKEAETEGGIFAVVALTAVLGLAAFQRNHRTHLRLAAIADASRRESAERLKLATEAAGVGIWEYDLTTGRVVWDESMFTLYGLDVSTFSPSYEGWHDTVLPEDFGGIENELPKAIKELKPVDFVFRIRRGDGEVRTIRAMG